MATATKTRNRYFNPNPKKLSTTDCVVRSMCKAVDKDWYTVMKELFEIGMELAVTPTTDDAWKEYLVRHGFVYNKFKRGTNRPTVDEFCRKEGKKGIHVLSLAGHLVTCVDGYHYDTWDASEKTLYGYWSKGE